MYICRCRCQCLWAARTWAARTSHGGSGSSSLSTSSRSSALVTRPTTLSARPRRRHGPPRPSRIILLHPHKFNFGDSIEKECNMTRSARPNGAVNAIPDRRVGSASRHTTHTRTHTHHSTRGACRPNTPMRRKLQAASAAQQREAEVVCREAAAILWVTARTESTNVK